MLLIALLFLVASCTKSLDYIDSAKSVGNISQISSMGNSIEILRYLQANPTLDLYAQDEELKRLLPNLNDSSILTLEAHLVDRRAFESAVYLVNRAYDVASLSGQAYVPSTLLHQAAEFGHSELVEIIVSKFPQSLTMLDSDRDNPLTSLVSMKKANLTLGQNTDNWEAIVRILLNANPNYLLAEGSANPVYKAIALGNPNLARVAFEHNPQYQGHIKRQFTDINPILIGICLSGETGSFTSDEDVRDMLQFMIEDIGINPDIKDSDSKPLVLYVMGAFIHSGQRNTKNYKPLATQYLLSKMRNYNVEYAYCCPLFSLVEHGTLADIQQYAHQDMDINKTIRGESALHKAIDLKKWDMALWLAENITEETATAENESKATPLNICVMKGQYKEIVPVVRALVSKGATLHKSINDVGGARGSAVAQRLARQQHNTLEEHLLLIVALGGNKKHFLSGIGPLVMPIINKKVPCATIDINRLVDGRQFDNTTTYLEAINSILSTEEFSILIGEWIKSDVKFSNAFHQFINTRYVWAHSMFSHVSNGYVGLADLILSHPDKYPRCLTDYSKRYKRSGQTTLDLAVENGYGNLIVKLEAAEFKKASDLKGKKAKRPVAEAGAGPSKAPAIEKTVWNAIEGKVNLKDIDKNQFTLTNQDGLRPIEYALEFGFKDKVPLLVKQGVSLFDADSLGRSMWMAIALSEDSGLLTQVLNSVEIKKDSIRESDKTIMQKGRLDPAICKILKAKGLSEYMPKVRPEAASAASIADEQVEERQLFEKVFVFKKNRSNWEQAIEARSVLRDNITRLKYDGAAASNVKHFNDGDYWQLRSGDVRVWYVIKSVLIDGESKSAMFILDCDPNKTETAKEKGWYERVQNLRDEHTRRNIDMNVWIEQGEF